MNDYLTGNYLANDFNMLEEAERQRKLREAEAMYQIQPIVEDPVASVAQRVRAPSYAPQLEQARAKLDTSVLNAYTPKPMSLKQSAIDGIMSIAPSLVARAILGSEYGGVAAGAGVRNAERLSALRQGQQEMAQEGALVQANQAAKEVARLEEAQQQAQLAEMKAQADAAAAEMDYETKLSLQENKQAGDIARVAKEFEFENQPISADEAVVFSTVSDIPADQLAKMPRAAATIAVESAVKNKKAQGEKIDPIALNAMVDLAGGPESRMGIALLAGVPSNTATNIANTVTGMEKTETNKKQAEAARLQEEAKAAAEKAKATIPGAKLIGQDISNDKEKSALREDMAITATVVSDYKGVNDIVNGLNGESISTPEGRRGLNMRVSNLISEFRKQQGAGASLTGDEAAKLKAMLPNPSSDDYKDQLKRFFFDLNSIVDINKYAEYQIGNIGIKLRSKGYDFDPEDFDRLSGGAYSALTKPAPTQQPGVGAKIDPNQFTKDGVFDKEAYKEAYKAARRP